MFKRVLIANRGEIALRIQRACRELEIEPVVVYSAADAEAIHVQLAEEAYCIGPARAADSYLNMDAILTVAKAAHCDAIHPGYGFLSENDQFADACAAAGIAFIGPSGDVIRAMGHKAAARRLMPQAGGPGGPGSGGAGRPAAELCAAYSDRGLPVVFWAPLDFQPVPGCDHWTLPNGRPFDWKLNEHCLLLVGYDDQHYWFNDPWHNHGLCPQPKALVEECHRAQGMYAVALRRK